MCAYSCGLVAVGYRERGLRRSLKSETCRFSCVRSCFNASIHPSYCSSLSSRALPLLRFTALCLHCSLPAPSLSFLPLPFLRCCSSVVGMASQRRDARVQSQSQSNFSHTQLNVTSRPSVNDSRGFEKTMAARREAQGVHDSLQHFTQQNSRSTAVNQSDARVEAMRRMRQFQTQNAEVRHGSHRVPACVGFLQFC